MLAVPIVGNYYVFLALYFLRFRETNSLAELGLRPGSTKFAMSIFLGILTGIFFFLVYFGAYPERLFPAKSILIQFNVYFLFYALSGELIFRVWMLNSLLKMFRPGRAIVLSSLIYMLAMLSTIGTDSTTRLIGEIDPFLVLETIFQSLWNGVFLAFMYYKTKSIYGNILFLFISLIPQAYSTGGLAHRASDLSCYISLLGLLLFLSMLIVSSFKNSRKSGTIPQLSDAHVRENQ
ncbi:CPBP family intramembrane metalloprotease [candidate division KSB1 bacterium]|nr:CPBP family intramembrane metalloprotease [candidate division KSB1 bacterium]